MTSKRKNKTLIIEFLQAVSHGASEHSVIYHRSRDSTEFWVANSKSDGMEWDAPYRRYHRFDFNEFFTEWNTTTTDAPQVNAREL